jgi:hypothetical protein
MKGFVSFLVTVFFIWNSVGTKIASSFIKWFSDNFCFLPLPSLRIDSVLPYRPRCKCCTDGKYDKYCPVY